MIVGGRKVAPYCGLISEGPFALLATQQLLTKLLWPLLLHGMEQQKGGRRLLFMRAHFLCLQRLLAAMNSTRKRRETIFLFSLLSGGQPGLSTPRNLQVSDSVMLQTCYCTSLEHTIRKVKFLSKNSILTKPQHFHEFFNQIFLTLFSRQIKVVNS